MSYVMYCKLCTKQLTQRFDIEQGPLACSDNAHCDTATGGQCVCDTAGEHPNCCMYTCQHYYS